MINSIPIVNTESKKGKRFLELVYELRDNIFSKPTKNPENVKQFKELSEKEIETNKWLLNIFKNMSREVKSMFEKMELKHLYVGNYGRKGGVKYNPIPEDCCRIYLHFGDSEVYYLDSSEYKSYPIIVNNGEGMLIPFHMGNDLSITIYKDPIRILNDIELQKLIPKIRGRNYNRIVLIYDYKFNLENLINKNDEE